MNTILRSFVLTFVCGVFLTPSLSKPITRQKASDVAKAYFASKGSVANAVLAYPIASTRGSESSSAPYYIFNSSDNNGFVIVAGDDDSESILGYSNSGSFNYDNAPEGLKDLLETYTTHVPTSQNTGTRATEWKAVAPMLTTKWGQNYPYNQSCPIFFNGERCLTGCVATAMAQVLYYFYKKYPDKVIKELPRDIPAYECEKDWEGYGHLSVEGIPQGTQIDWKNMCDEIDGASSNVTIKAVSDLLYYCATSIKSDFSDFSNNGTGARFLSSNARDANGTPIIVGADYSLWKYFEFNNNSDKAETKIIPNNWIDLIYNEMINQRPVIFSGKDIEDNGHSFIIDGCSTEKMFHINWGWEGNYNGFYKLDALITTVGDFSNKPNMIYNISPRVISYIHLPDVTNHLNEKINIYNITGRRVGQTQLSTFKIDLGKLNRGIFIINGHKIVK